MTNNIQNAGILAVAAKTISAFLGSFFVSNSSREFQRLKNFIAS